MAEFGGCTRGDAFDGDAGLHRQTVADGVDGQLAHGSLAGPDGCDGVHSTPKLNPADKVSPIDRDELFEGCGVLVVEGGGKIFQGILKFLTDWRVGVKTKTEGKETKRGEIQNLCADFQIDL